MSYVETTAVMITIRMDSEERAELKLAARRAGMTLNAFCRSRLGLPTEGVRKPAQPKPRKAGSIRQNPHWRGARDEAGNQIEAEDLAECS